VLRIGSTREHGTGAALATPSQYGRVAVERMPAAIARQACDLATFAHGAARIETRVAAVDPVRATPSTV